MDSSTPADHERFVKVLEAFVYVLRVVLPSMNRATETHQASSQAAHSHHGKAVEVDNPSTFLQYINQPGLTVVDFYANWCGPCRQFAPIFIQWSTRFTDVTFLKVNVDTPAMRSVMMSAGVTAMPTISFYKSGKKCADNVQGAMASRILSVIQEHR